MSWELVTQAVLGLIAIGSFVGQTKYALKVIGDKLDRLQELCYTCDQRLTLIETHLRGNRVENKP